MVLIASQAAILRAARAVPGGARPTPAPQGSQIGMGQISPLVRNEDTQAGYAYSYSPFLPRPSRTFTEGAFGPFAPILPVPVDTPAPGAELPDPRRFDYPTGFNLPSIPGQDGFRLASFQTLDTISRLYSVARTCIQRRKMMIAGLEWDIVPTREAAKAYSGSHAAMKDFGERRSEAVRFWDKPDPNYFSFDSYMSALLEQVFVFDALSIVMRPKRGKGLGRGILGSDLDCLELIDGETIRPLLNLHGGMPRPPAPYVQQYIAGVPRSDFQSMWDGRDIEEAGLKGYEGPAFSSDQMLYLPTVPRANSPYGMSATEMALVVIMTGLRKQAYQLEYYSEGTVPAVYISPGDVNMTPAQIRELQAALNGFANDQAWHHKIIVTPPGSRIDPMRPAQLADQFDEIVMGEVAMVYDVDPMSLGIVPQVSTAVSPFAAKEMAQASRTVHERTSNKPLLKFLASISNAILHRVCGQDDMKFTFSGMDEAQDQAAQTDMLVKQVQSGLISIDEAREELQRTAWGLDETSGPLVFTQMGPVPLNQVIEMMAQMQPMAGGQTAPANTSNSVTASHQPRAVHHPPSSRPVGTHNPRLGLPSGGGLSPKPGGVSDTPAHAAARAHQDAGKADALRDELRLLAKHVRKGRDVATWTARHIPGVVMATITEDLTKGIGAGEAFREAAAVALGPGDYEWLAKAAAPPPFPPGSQQAQAQALAQQYTAQVQAVFAQVQAQAAALVAAWLAGTLAVTAMALASMITALLAKLLGDVLRSLWAAAWQLGEETAADLLGADAPGGSETAFAAWADSRGRDWLEQITSTREDDLAAGLYAAAQDGQDAATIASRIGEWLDAANRAALIAVDQVQRAFSAAMAWIARRLGVMQKRWITRNDALVCARCKANQAQGWVNFDAPYPSGLLVPPGHPRCVIGSTRIAAPASDIVPADVPDGLAGNPAPLGAVTGGEARLAPAPAVAVAERDFGRGNIRAVTSREYVGDVVVIRTALGHELTATPNHPVATRGGWVPISELKVGEYVLSSTSREWMTSAVDPDVDDIPPCIEDVAQSFPMVLGRVPTAPEDFHGDGAGSDVCVIRADSLLVDNLAPGIAKHGGECQLGGRDVAVDGSLPFDAERSLDEELAGLGLPANGVMGGTGETCALCGTGLSHAEVHGLAASPGRDASPGQPRPDSRPADAECGSKSLLALSGDVTFHDGGLVYGDLEPGYSLERFTGTPGPDSGAAESGADRRQADADGFCERLESLASDITADEIVHVERLRLRTHVYNLETTEGWYIGNGIVTHNCRCREDYRVSLDAAAQKLAGGRRYVDLPGQEWWPAGSYPHGPAMGGGGRMLPAHDADGIEEYIPGGVPGMTAGGEPPRWPGSEAAALVSPSEPTVSAGRGNPPTRGGGTVGDPYQDFSDETHAFSPEDADDAAWPGPRAVGPVPGRSWPQQGYMGGYWPQGGHGTAQSPATSIGSGPRGRPPNAVGKNDSG